MCAALCRFSCSPLEFWCPIADIYRHTLHLRSFEIPKNTPFLHHREGTKQGQVTPWSYLPIFRKGVLFQRLIPSLSAHSEQSMDTPLVLSCGHILAPATDPWGQSHPQQSSSSVCCLSVLLTRLFVPGQISWKSRATGTGRICSQHTHRAENPARNSTGLLLEGTGKKRNLAWQRCTHNTQPQRKARKFEQGINPCQCQWLEWDRQDKGGNQCQCWERSWSRLGRTCSVWPENGRLEGGVWFLNLHGEGGDWKECWHWNDPSPAGDGFRLETGREPKWGGEWGCSRVSCGRQSGIYSSWHTIYPRAPSCELFCQSCELRKTGWRDPSLLS